MRETWRPAASALALLDAETVGPFASSAGRRALAHGLDGWRDASFGAVLERDGTQAAIALLTDGGRADSVPWAYGGIVASRALSRSEASALLRQSAAAAGVSAVYVRSIPDLAMGPASAGGTTLAVTHAVRFDPATPPDHQFTPKAAQSIRRAERAGCVVSVVVDPSAALSLYATVAVTRETIYPQKLIVAFADAGIASSYEVRIGDDLVAALIGLRHPAHWMYWIAAQNERGRRAEAGYLALATFIRDAYTAGVPAVNLGASQGLPGVAKFKRRFGAVEMPVVEHRYVPAGTRVRLRARFQLARLKGVAHRALGRQR